MTFCCVTRGSFFGRRSSTLQPGVTLHSPTTPLIIGRAESTHAWRQHSGNVKAPIFLFCSLYYRQIELWASIKQGMDIKEAVGVVKQRRKGGNKERQDGNKLAFSLICDEIFIVKYCSISFTKSRRFFWQMYICACGTWKRLCHNNQCSQIKHFYYKATKWHKIVSTIKKEGEKQQYVNDKTKIERQGDYSQNMKFAVLLQFAFVYTKSIWIKSMDQLN